MGELSNARHERFAQELQGIPQCLRGERGLSRLRTGTPWCGRAEPLPPIPIIGPSGRFQRLAVSLRDWRKSGQTAHMTLQPIFSPMPQRLLCVNFPLARCFPSPEGAMRRREFIAVLGGAVTWPLTGRSQTTPVVGIVFSGAVSSAAAHAPLVTKFKLGLEAVGFIEGRNVAVEYHWLSGHDESLPALMAELVQRQAAVIVGDTSPAIAAKAATSTIPIVFMTDTDPVRLGLVASFNRPGSNATGVTFLNSTLDAKRLGLLHELLPQATVIASLLDPNYPTSANQIEDLQNAASALGLQVRVLPVSNENQIDQAFATFANVRPDALVVSASGFLGARRNQIIELAARHSLPTMGFDRDFPAGGGLISYGANVPDVWNQAGVYVGRILKGQKPAEMPVLQPTKFEFVINLKTANALGLAIPDKILAVADEVIE